MLTEAHVRDLSAGSADRLYRQEASAVINNSDGIGSNRETRPHGNQNTAASRVPCSFRLDLHWNSRRQEQAKARWQGEAQLHDSRRTQDGCWHWGNCPEGNTWTSTSPSRNMMKQGDGDEPGWITPGGRRTGADAKPSVPMLMLEERWVPPETRKQRGMGEPMPPRWEGLSVDFVTLHQWSDGTTTTTKYP